MSHHKIIGLILHDLYHDNCGKYILILSIELSRNDYLMFLEQFRLLLGEVICVALFGEG